MSQNRYRSSLALVLFCLAVGLLILSVLPYTQFKAFFDSWMADGDFESLKEGNALIFRAYVILAGLGVMTFALLLSGKWRLDGKGLKGDFSSLWHFFRPARDEKYFVLTLAGVTLWGAAIRLVNILAPISHDEAYTATVFSPSLFYAMTNYHAPNNQVLHTLLVHFSTVLFGFSTWSVRLPAFLAGTLIIPAAYWFGKAMYDRYTGLLAAVLVAWWPIQVGYSNNARGYSLVALLALLVFWLGLVVRREKNLVGWSLIVLLSALGFYAVPVMLFPFGILFIWLGMENLAAVPGQGYRSKVDFIKYWTSAGLAAALLTFVLYSPIFIYGGLRQFFLNGVQNPFGQAGALIQSNLQGAYFEWVSGMPDFVSLALTAGLLLGLVFHRKLSPLRIPLQVATVLWIGLILILQRPNAWARIWFPLAALFMIWASAGLAGLIKDIRFARLGNVSAAAVLILVAILGVFGSGMPQLSTLPQAWAHQGREEQAVLFIKDKLGEQDIILAPTPQDAPLWYYSRLHGVPDRVFSRSDSFERAFLITVPILGQYKESVIEEYGLTDAVDMQTLKLLKEINGMNIYEVMHR
jgi:4-amino-4-deoxy-L-arabinose transferase-like glycosyltransferase